MTVGNLKGVYVRHDIDYSFQKAYTLAMLEADADIQTTYMVQLHSPFYNPLTQDNLTKLKQMAEHHVIGLHYDTRCTPSSKLVENEARYLGQILGVPVDLFAAHDWLMRDKRITVPTDLMLMDAKYISDSGGRWREGCFCKHLGKHPKLQVLIHPEWWWHEPLSTQESLDQIYKLNAQEILASHKFLNSHLLRYYERRKAEFYKQTEDRTGPRGSNQK